MFHHAPETELWLIRHGESEGNRARRWQGWYDTPLSARGLAEAQALADYLARWVRHGRRFQALYTSDLRRAAETARILGEALGLSPIQDVRLREGDLGTWSNRTVVEIATHFPEEWAYWERTYDPMHPRGGGESQVAMQRRIVEALTTLARHHPHERILIVSHGGILRTALVWFLGMPIGESWRLRLSNTGISRIRLSLQGQMQQCRPGIVLALNERPHLCGEEE